MLRSPLKLQKQQQRIALRVTVTGSAWDHAPTLMKATKLVDREHILFSVFLRCR
jgi:hypothetical protein